MDKIVVANLKTYLNADDVLSYLKDTNDLRKKSVIMCPTSIYIPYFLKHQFQVGIQDISMYEEGVHTGDVLASQAASLGIKYSIIGHSERIDRETPNDINKKIVACNIHGIIPILCVGEEKDNKKALKNIKNYLEKCLKNTLINKVIIAYEPIWTIGNDNIPSVNLIEERVIYIKRIIKELFNQDIKVLYGGSISKENIKALKDIEVIDGVLIGGSSSMSSEFNEIVSKYLD